MGNFQTRFSAAARILAAAEICAHQMQIQFEGFMAMLCVL